MIWIDVDTAIELFVNVDPLVSDSDGKTIDDTIAYNESGMDLNWNFLTPNGTVTQTNVVPTTGGNYDWTLVGNGIYKIEMPASGGASINNNTEGFGWFSGVCAGVLPWVSPIYGFRAAGLNDKLVESAYSTTRGLAGTALPDAAADAVGGLPISDAGGLDLDAIKAKTDNLPPDPADQSAVEAAITAATSPLALEASLTAIKGAGWSTETLVSIKGLVDDLESRLTAARAGYLDELGAANIPADIDTLLARLTALRAGYLDNLSGGAVALQASVDDLEGRLTADRAGKLDNLDATISSRLATADYTAPDNVSIAAIKGKTDNLPSDPADQSLVEAAITAAVAQVLGFDIGDSASLAADSWPEKLRKLCWSVMSKMVVVDATGAFTIYKADGVTPAATGTIVDDTTNTTRSAPAWA